jgi:hypothetical protein
MTLFSWLSDSQPPLAVAFTADKFLFRRAIKEAMCLRGADPAKVRRLATPWCGRAFPPTAGLSALG